MRSCHIQTLFSLGAIGVNLYLAVAAMIRGVMTRLWDYHIVQWSQPSTRKNAFLIPCLWMMIQYQERMNSCYWIASKSSRKETFCFINGLIRRLGWALVLLEASCLRSSFCFFPSLFWKHGWLHVLLPDLRLFYMCYAAKSEVTAEPREREFRSTIERTDLVLGRCPSCWEGKGAWVLRCTWRLCRKSRECSVDPKCRVCDEAVRGTRRTIESLAMTQPNPTFTAGRYSAAQHRRTSTTAANVGSDAVEQSSKNDLERTSMASHMCRRESGKMQPFSLKPSRV